MYVFWAYNFRFLFSFKEPLKELPANYFHEIYSFHCGMFKYYGIALSTVKYIYTFVNTSVDLNRLACSAQF